MGSAKLVPAPVAADAGREGQEEKRGQSAPLPGIGPEAPLEISAKYPLPDCFYNCGWSSPVLVIYYYTTPLVLGPAETAFLLLGEALPEGGKREGDRDCWCHIRCYRNRVKKVGALQGNKQESCLMCHPLPRHPAVALGVSSSTAAALGACAYFAFSFLQIRAARTDLQGAATAFLSSSGAIGWWGPGPRHINATACAAGRDSRRDRVERRGCGHTPSNRPPLARREGRAPPLAPAGSPGGRQRLVQYPPEFSRPRPRWRGRTGAVPRRSAGPRRAACAWG